MHACQESDRPLEKLTMSVGCDAAGGGREGTIVFWWVRSPAWKGGAATCVSVLKWFGLAAILCGQEAPKVPRADIEQGEAGAHLLLIDHSGSMNRPAESGVGSGETRWRVMQRAAVDYVKLLKPNGAKLWFKVFKNDAAACDPREFILDSEAARNDVIAFIQDYPAPENRNWTPLWDAMGEAFELAEKISIQTPGRDVWVLVYTDGEDSNIDDTGPGSKTWTEEKIQKRFGSLKRVNPNVYLIKGGIGRILVPVTLRPADVSLPNLKARPKQAVEFCFDAKDFIEGSLAGVEANLAVRGVGPVAGLVTISPSRVKLGRGPFPLELVARDPDSLRFDQEVSVELAASFSEHPRYDLRQANAVRLRWQAKGPIKVEAWRPESGSTFPVEKPVRFSVVTLRDARVVWDFGDGESGSGPEVTHIYHKCGPMEARLSVIDPEGGPKFEAKIDLVIEDVGISLDPVAKRVFAGRPTRFTCTTRGKFRHVEWWIDGRAYEGKPRDDGVAGFVIEYLFSDAGPHEISVLGHAERTTLASEPIRVPVEREPRLTIVGPIEGATVAYDKPSMYAAEVEGDHINTVRFEVVHGQTGEVLMSARSIPVVGDGSKRRASFEFALPLREGRTPATLRAVAESRVQDAALPEPADVKFTYEEPKTAIRIVLLGEDQSVRIGQPFELKLEATGPVTDRRWSFGDGSADDSDQEIVAHTYRQYGGYKVIASARMRDGTRVEAEPITILVQKVPVQAAMEVKLHGLDVGTAVHSVPVGATLALKDLSTGDVQERLWFFNGKQLPAGEASVIVRERGPNAIRLEVKGFPGAGDGSCELHFVARNYPLFLAACVPLAAMVVCAYWAFLAKNAAMGHRFFFGADPDPQHNVMSCDIRPYWRRWSKTASIPAMDLVSQLPESLDADTELSRDWGAKADDLLILLDADGSLAINRERGDLTWALHQRRATDEHGNSLPDTIRWYELKATGGRPGNGCYLFLKLDRTEGAPATEWLWFTMVCAACVGTAMCVWWFAT